jgi:DNA modification methylase
MRNSLICGDNMAILPTLEKESVDLIYVDPPFFSNRNYEIIWGDEAEITSFEDRWEGGINVYIEWMKQRVIELHRVLKPNGTFYLHCDWHAGHYLKVMCDEIFGYGNFVNEIVWCYDTGGRSTSFFPRKHDVIFRYEGRGGAQFYYDQVALKRDPSTMHETVKKDIEGRSYQSNVKAGKEYRYYMDKGVLPNDWWTDIQALNPAAKERLGYPTQKPEALLHRIMSASTKPDGLVLDAFCGCGTTMAVAQKTGRRWIGIDISPSAIATIKNRFARDSVDPRTYDVIGMPQKDEDLKAFKPGDFQYWAVNEMHGTPSPKIVGDMGIDGLSFINHYPIQVKQSESVGRPVVDNFETALRRYYKTKKEMVGYIVAFSFTKGAFEEVARVKNEGMKIELVKVQDIIDRKFAIKQETLL